MGSLLSLIYMRTICSIMYVSYKKACITTSLSAGQLFLKKTDACATGTSGLGILLGEQYKSCIYATGEPRDRWFRGRAPSLLQCSCSRQHFPSQRGRSYLCMRLEFIRTFHLTRKKLPGIKYDTFCIIVLSVGLKIKCQSVFKNYFFAFTTATVDTVLCTTVVVVLLDLHVLFVYCLI